jgi:hypothetical protein
MVCVRSTAGWEGACSARRAGRTWNTLHGSKYFCTENGSSQGQTLAVTVLHVPGSLDSGMGGCLLREMSWADLEHLTGD